MCQQINWSADELVSNQIKAETDSRKAGPDPFTFQHKTPTRLSLVGTATTPFSGNPTLAMILDRGLCE